MGREARSVFPLQKKLVPFSTWGIPRWGAVTNMCRFSQTRLLSSWRNTLRSLIFAFPSFLVLPLLSAKGCVHLKTKSKYKLLCHMTLIFWKPGQDLAHMSVWSRYLKLSYLLQSPYTAQVIQLNKDKCLLRESCTIVWTLLPGFPLTWVGAETPVVSAMGSWTIQTSLVLLLFELLCFSCTLISAWGNRNGWWKWLWVNWEDKPLFWMCESWCTENLQMSLRTLSASLHCMVEEFERPLFQHGPWNWPGGWVTVQSSSGPYRNQWLLSTLEIGLFIWTINKTELVAIPGPRYECWKWGLGLTDHDLQSCWALWDLWQDTGAQCFWKHHVLS